jgi:predicted adenylyl cyclase CyaB
MTFEVELKAWVKQPTIVEAAAARLGTFRGESTKEDVYFRRRGDNQTVPFNRYRLRREGEQAVVTFKQQVEAGDTEVNEEVEFTVSEARAFFRFAHYLGYEPFVVKHKISRVYRVGRVNIELNEVKHLGHFAEIEILCQETAEISLAQAEIRHLLLRLGLREADLEPRRYIEMIQEVHRVRYRYLLDSESEWPFEEMG